MLQCMKLSPEGTGDKRSSDQHGIRPRNGSLRICVNAGIDPFTGKRRQLTETVRGTSREAWLTAEKRRRALEERAREMRNEWAAGHTVGEMLDKWLETA